MAYRYKPNKYTIYDESLTFEENYQNDAVITKKKLDRLEEQVKLNSADWGIGQVKYVDKTEDADFSIEFNELEGTHRFNMSIPVRGKSAYQSWLDIGNTGTEEDFINALRGDTYQHRVFLNKVVLEDIHNNDDEFTSIIEYFEDEVRICITRTNIDKGIPPQFNAKFYGPMDAVSAKITYSPNMNDTRYKRVDVSTDYDNCKYIGRRIDSGELDESGTWLYHWPSNDRLYWKVLWYDADDKLIGADRFKILFVNDVAGLFSENDSDTALALKQEFSIMLNDSINALREELMAEIGVLDNRTKVKKV